MVMLFASIVFSVYPQTCMAPCPIHMKIIVAREAENRLLKVEDEIEGLVTEKQMDGESSHLVYDIFWTLKEVGDHQLRAKVVKAGGREEFAIPLTVIVANSGRMR